MKRHHRDKCKRAVLKINILLNRHSYKQWASSLCILMPSDTCLLISVSLQDLRGVDLLNMRDTVMFSHLQDAAVTNDLQAGERWETEML